MEFESDFFQKKFVGLWEMKEFLVGKRILTKEEGEQLYLTVSRKKWSTREEERDTENIED